LTAFSCVASPDEIELPAPRRAPIEQSPGAFRIGRQGVPMMVRFPHGAALALILVLPILQACGARAAPGPTPARTQLQRMLAAVNSGDRATIEAFTTSIYSPQGKDLPGVDRALYAHKQFGGFDLLEIDDD
jgi:hypothetical protein